MLGVPVRILFVLVLGRVLLVDAPPPSGEPVARAGAADPPNILVIMTDDQRASADGLSVMDDLQRRFGDQGTYFPNAVATTPLCCPSRASIFTGKYVHNHGVTTQKNATNMPQKWTMQYQLKQHGYTSALVGRYLNNGSGPKPYFDYAKSGVFTKYYNGSGQYTTTVQTGMATGLLDTFEKNDAKPWLMYCLLYTSDAADDLLCVDLGGRRILKKKNPSETRTSTPKSPGSTKTCTKTRSSL